jgi:DNA polymerase III epsilon subunit-like protein
MPRATWFCVDIECSGPVPVAFDMISLGAVAVTLGPDGRYAVGDDSFYVELRPRSAEVDPGAMKVNGLDIDALRAHGRDLAEALAELTAWVKARTLPGSKPVFVGHNAPFDWSFVNHAYHDVGLANPFGYKALDTKALATGKLGIHWFDSGKEVLEQRLNLEPEDLGLKHRADYDALYQAKLLIKLLEA